MDEAGRNMMAGVDMERGGSEWEWVARSRMMDSTGRFQVEEVEAVADSKNRMGGDRSHLDVEEEGRNRVDHNMVLRGICEEASGERDNLLAGPDEGLVDLFRVWLPLLVWKLSWHRQYRLGWVPYSPKACQF